MELVFDYVLRGIHAALFTPDGAFAWMTLVMVVTGLVGGIVVGAVPGLNGPFAMAIALPVLISSFGTDNDALLPVLAFLIGVMKGSTLGGAVPAVLSALFVPVAALPPEFPGAVSICSTWLSFREYPLCAARARMPITG